MNKVTNKVIMNAIGDNIGFSLSFLWVDCQALGLAQTVTVK
jgi:hypothetical protein